MKDVTSVIAIKKEDLSDTERGLFVPKKTPHSITHIELHNKMILCLLGRRNTRWIACKVIHYVYYSDRYLDGGGISTPFSAPKVVHTLHNCVLALYDNGCPNMKNRG